MNETPSVTLEGPGSWVISLNDGVGYTVNGDGKGITFDSPDASGTITYWDGSQVSFQETESVIWS